MNEPNQAAKARRGIGRRAPAWSPLSPDRARVWSTPRQDLASLSLEARQRQGELRWAAKVVALAALASWACLGLLWAGFRWLVKA